MQAVAPAATAAVGYTCAMNWSWYAETPARRSRQVMGDVLAVVGLLLCVWIGSTVHDATTRLVGPGETIEAAGAGLAERMDGAADAADGIPAVGDDLAEQFAEAGGVGERIESAGREQQQVVRTLATVLGWTAGGLPAAYLLLRWLSNRLRFARLAGEARLLRGSDAGLDLLALRALAAQPLRQLMLLKDPPVSGWRAQDRDAVAALAALELHRLGVRAPSDPRPE
jgi:hypothetical protein